MKFEKNENFLEKNRNLIQIIQINPPQRKKKTYSENSSQIPETPMKINKRTFKKATKLQQNKKECIHIETAHKK
jgi:hypothetical protein